MIASVGLYAGEATGRVYAEKVLVNLLFFLSQYDINCGSDRYRLYSIYSIVVNLSMFSDRQLFINLFQVNFILLLTPG